jgi:hypothetical protein
VRGRAGGAPKQAAEAKQPRRRTAHGPQRGRAQKGQRAPTGKALPDLGPVLSPPGFCCLPVSCSGGGSKMFPLGPQNGRHVRSSRHFLIERKAKSNAGGLHMLLIIMWPDNTLAILLLQLLLN